MRGALPSTSGPPRPGGAEPGLPAAARLLPGGDFQTALAAVPARYPAWLPEPSVHELRVAENARVRLHVTPACQPAPMVLLVHGFTGSAESPCVLRTAAEAHRRGYAVARVDLRNAGDTHHLTEGLFNLQQWPDLGVALEFLASRFAPRGLFAIGFSLGGALLLNLLGRHPEHADLLEAAVAVNPPIDIPVSVRSVGRARNRLYARSFLSRLRRDVRLKRALGRDYADPARPRPRTVPEYDRRFVLPETPYARLDEYYEESSATPYLGGIRARCAIRTSRDDPIVPSSQIEAIDKRRVGVAVCVLDRGGHVGYFGPRGARLHSWAADAALEFLARERRPTRPVKHSAAGAARGAQGLLRFKADRRTLAHVALTAGAYGLALAHSLWWTPVAVFLGMHLVAAQHNHAHLPVFRRDRLNRLLDHAFHVLCGIPVLFWRVHHVSRHHHHTWTERDWSSPFLFARARAPDRPVGYRYYQIAYLPLFHFESAVHVLRSRNPRQLRRLLESWLVFAGAVLAAAAAFGPLECALVLGSAYAAGGLGLGAANYLEHWNVHHGDGEYLAWTFTCPIHNFLNYNLGYHQLHHDRPGLHWSLLAETDARLSSRRRPDLVETGLYPSYRGRRAFHQWLERAGGTRGARPSSPASTGLEAPTPMGNGSA